MAFQQVQAVSVPDNTGYTGPIISGEEIELLEAYAEDIDNRFG